MGKLKWQLEMAGVTRQRKHTTFTTLTVISGRWPRQNEPAGGIGQLTKARHTPIASGMFQKLYKTNRAREHPAER